MDEHLMPLPRAILFDMDGTLTRPMLDFPKIKAEMGIGERPILEALAEMDPTSRAAAEVILLRHEGQAAAESVLNPGCCELLDWLAARAIPIALITRNSDDSVRTVIERHGLVVNFSLSRCDARPKPDPQSLHLACDRLRVRESDVWMVGDGQYDVEAGLGAGVRTVWLSHGRPKPFDAEPWRTVPDLTALREMLAACVQRIAAGRV